MKPFFLGYVIGTNSFPVKDREVTKKAFYRNRPYEITWISLTLSSQAVQKPTTLVLRIMALLEEGIYLVMHMLK